MKNKIYKISTIILLILLVAIKLKAQSSISRSAFFLDGYNIKTVLNPALTPKNSYFSIPLIGSINLGTQSNISLDKFIFPNSETNSSELFMSNNISSETFLKGIEKDNNFDLNLRDEILSFGFWIGKGSYLNFNVATRSNFSFDLPYEFFEFAKKGMSNKEGSTYNIKDFGLSSNTFIETGVGFSKKINLEYLPNLTIGAKVKYLIGGYYAKAYFNELDIKMLPNEYKVTSNSQVDIYGQEFTFENDEDGYVDWDTSNNNTGIGGSGLAFDLGLSFSPIKNLDISLGITDLGSIKWDADKSFSAKAEGEATYTGFENIGQEDEDLDSREKSVSDQADDLSDDFENLIKMKQSSRKDYTQKLNPLMSISAEYSFYNRKLSAAGLYTQRFSNSEKEKYGEIMGAIMYRPKNWFQLAGTYSLIHGNGNGLGFAMNICPRYIDFFVSCDYLFTQVNPDFIPISTSTTNFQIGLNIPLSKRR